MHKLQVEAAPQVAAKLWTPANIVTLIRICLVPVFVVVLLSPWPQWFHLPDLAEHSKSLIAAAIFVLISCTDWLDGYLARSRGEVTDFGKFMDPLADKILVMAALLALIELGSLPSWVALIIVAREFIVSGVRMVAASKGTVISASWYGKFKTVFQIDREWSLLSRRGRRGRSRVPQGVLGRPVGTSCGMLLIGNAWLLTVDVDGSTKFVKATRDPRVGAVGQAREAPCGSAGEAAAADAGEDEARRATRSAPRRPRASRPSASRRAQAVARARGGTCRRRRPSARPRASRAASISR